MARQARCNRVHSALTHQVNMIEAGKFNMHAVFLTFASGQLRFLGSMPSRVMDSRCAASIEAGIEKQRSVAPDFVAELAQWLALMDLQFAPFILPVTPAIA